ncbi:MAG: AraD1 family protein [Planctomycetales bacterium]
MRLIQFLDEQSSPALGVVVDQQVCHVTGLDSKLDSVGAAFQAARRAGQRVAPFLQKLLQQAPASAYQSYPALCSSGRLLPPVSEAPGRRVLVTGTGLTHLGSAQQRDAMHATQAGTDAPPPQKSGSTAAPEPKSDSKRMFEWGVVGGKPAAGQRGAAPEWFYKGDGRKLRTLGDPLEIPEFAPDGGEEPELAGVYIIDDAGIPFRLGFVQGNEWSDHVTENLNYLYLAPSKLRTCSIGPELVTDLAFDDISLRCRVLRDGVPLYDSGELRSGEKNMCHSLANLEDHHFKFPHHRQPGDIHVHFFGTSKLSYPGRAWKYQTGDVVEVSAEGLGVPLRNPVLRKPCSDAPVSVERA